ncbi:MAG: outer membrane beta-barrel domain-containing protein [Deltaproteobacteria bacterium]|nr:outer membrane beta-barrel domain-containing protein [Deltaproteobacteria bacterium]MBW2537097.1 outer membrane beta-barrel domain-containing protein [Deltaproteobacteria bacterium]
MDASAARELDEEMYAVQQIYALRARRFEINPYFGLTMNDQFVSHNGPGLTLNYYITNVIAVGINGNIYHGMNSISGFNFETSRAARIGMPITEYSWNANANFTYVPAYGKFAGFQDFIFHWDFYVLAGVGAISTRPIAVVDPDNRFFDYEPTVTFGAGGGFRIFFNRWLAVTLEIRDYIFFDRLENPEIVTGFEPDGTPSAQVEDNWLAEDRSFTNNVQAQLGLAVFLPFTWEYRLPK